MSVLVLGPGPRPLWLRPLEAARPGGPDAILVVNDLSEGALRELSRACALRAERPSLEVAVLTLVERGQAAADALLAALPPGRSLAADPRLAMALIGTRWSESTLRTDREGTTFEYQD
jgi:hypothetical protein